MHIVPRIDRAQRRDLVRTGYKTGDVATLKRFYAVALLGAGKSSPTVADIVCVAVSTVVRAAHAYLAGGVEALYDKRLRNGRPKADGPFRARVTAMLRGTPEDFGWSRPTWTRELLCRQAEREGRPAVSVSTMGRVLARIGARLGTPKPVVLYRPLEAPRPREERALLEASPVRHGNHRRSDGDHRPCGKRDDGEPLGRDRERRRGRRCSGHRCRHRERLRRR